MDDAVSNWMELTSAYGVVVARNRLPRVWAVRIPARPVVSFHIVEKGSACVMVPGERPVHMNAGDLVLVPHGHTHVVGNSPTTRPRELDQLERIRVSPATHATTLVCGEYRSDLGSCTQMTRRLPDVVHFTATALDADPALRSVMKVLCDELASARPGREIVVQHMLGALLACAFRAWTIAAPDGWPAALANAELAPVLAQIHERPQQPWTVESLAKVARLSRAAFARRFRDTVGEPPLEYVTRVRMALAARLLQSDAKLAEVSAAVGYTSEFAFSRAFKRTLGASPRAHRARSTA